MINVERIIAGIPAEMVDIQTLQSHPTVEAAAEEVAVDPVEMVTVVSTSAALHESMCSQSSELRRLLTFRTYRDFQSSARGGVSSAAASLPPCSGARKAPLGLTRLRSALMQRR